MRYSYIQYHIFASIIVDIFFQFIKISLYYNKVF